MIDPITQKLTQEITKTAVADLKNTAATPTNFQVEQSAFGQMFDQKISAGSAPTGSNNDLMQFAENVMEGFNGKPMNAIPAGEIQVDINRASEIQFEGSGNANFAASFFGDVNNSSIQMEKVINQVFSGSKFSMKDMLQVQVLAQNHTMMVEMMSKGVEIGSRCVQSTAQMQV